MAPATRVSDVAVRELKSLLAFAGPYRGTLAFCVLLMLLESAAALAVPWLGGQLAGVLR